MNVLDEKKRKNLGKIRKLKEGDPEDMTVILLREVLLEMEVNFKASDSKEKFIERVLTERSKANRANNASQQKNNRRRAHSRSNINIIRFVLYNFNNFKILHVLRFHSEYNKTSSRAQHQCGSAHEYILCLLY